MDRVKRLVALLIGKAPWRKQAMVRALGRHGESASCANLYNIGFCGS
jgi:hypothetical protein